MKTWIKFSCFGCCALFASVVCAQQGAVVGDQIPNQTAPLGQLAPAPAQDVVPAAELQEALQELEAAHAENYNALAKIAETAPTLARPAIQQAMNNSRRGWEHARQNRQRAQAKRQEKMASRQNKGGGKPSWAGQGGQSQGSFGQDGRDAQMKGRSSGQSETRRPQFAQQGQGQAGQRPTAQGQQSAQARQAQQGQAQDRQQQFSDQLRTARGPQSTQQGGPPASGGNGKGRGKSRR